MPLASPQKASGRWSFPSGHTASAFIGAGFLQRRYGWKYGVPAYLAAGFVGASRVITKWHWIGDVIIGAGIGIGVNYLFTTPYQVTVTPYLKPHEQGVAIEAAL